MKKWVTLVVLLAALVAAGFVYFSPSRDVQPSATTQLPDGEFASALDGLYGQRLTSIDSMVASAHEVRVELTLDVGFPGRTEPYLVLRALAEDYPETSVRTLEFSGPVAPDANTLLFTDYVWDSSTGYFDYWEGSGPKPQRLPDGTSVSGASMIEHLVSATQFDDDALEQIISGVSLSEATSITMSHPTRRTEDMSGR